MRHSGTAAYQRERYAANPEIRRAYQQTWHANNLDKSRAQKRAVMKRLYDADPEKYRARARRWRAAHRERSRDWIRRWTIENRETWRLIQRGTRSRRRAAKKAGHIRYSVTDLNLIYESQSGLCLYCGNAINRRLSTFGTHLDHMTPLARGGTDNASNIAFSCATCNYRKNAQTVEEFVA